MPICTECTVQVPHLYTVYQSAHNLRLEQCSNCQAFADPYVEHDTLTIILDLILLKRSVYRHLLYNRGSEPRRAADAADTPKKEDARKNNPRKERWSLILRLGAALLMVDAFIRWTHIPALKTKWLKVDQDPNQPFDESPWTIETAQAFGRIFTGCLAETAAFHIGILLSCFLVLRTVDAYKSLRKRSRGADTKAPTSSSNHKSLPAAAPPPSGIRTEFRYGLVPLTLLYSSLTKLFLLFLLSIWRPAVPAQDSAYIASEPIKSSGPSFYGNPHISGALRLLDEDFLDREWVVRNVLGGMSAGFGLKVVLDIHPILTTFVIFSGWGVKTVIANLVSGWVGGESEGAGEAWLAYSIP